MSKSVFFVSDFHLGASYLKDKKEAERRVVAFLDSIKDRAEAIYLLGDILDYWYEYKYVVPRGFTRFFGKIAELSDAGVKITWIIGNHDIWIFDYLPQELGISVHDGSLLATIQNQKIFMAHGDGCGHQPMSFRFLRAFFRNRFCQKLYSAIHPRLTVGFALAWSSRSRKQDCCDAFKGEKEDLVKFSRCYLDKHPDIDFFIFGHRHVEADWKIGAHTRVIMLGEWIRLCSYAELSDGTLSLKQFKY